MISVKQTKFGKEGNCLAACLASLLEVDINLFPDISQEPSLWLSKINKYLIAEYELYLFPITLSDLEEAFQIMEDTIFIGSGYSNRGLFHATLWKNGKMIFDSHPDNTGIKKLESLDFLVKYFK